MAEVIGLVASIVNVLDGIHKTTLFIRSHVHSATSLQTELSPVLGKLTALKGVLQGLQLEYELAGSKNGRLHALSHLDGPLTACDVAIKTVMARLDRIRSMNQASLIFGKLLDRETMSALRVIDNTRPVLDLALSADQTTLLRSIENYTQNIAAELQNLSRLTHSHLETLEPLLEAHKSADINQEKQRAQTDLLDWISELDHTINLAAALKHVLPEDTAGQWFLQSNTFQDWMTMPEQRVITLAGNAGAGKTVLSAKTISRLTQGYDQVSAHSVIVYHFFDFNDSSKQTVEGMIRSIIRQLVSKADTVPDTAMLWHKQNNNPQGSVPCRSLAEWIMMLTEILQTHEKLFIIVDALDECSQSEQTLLVSTIQKLLNCSSLTVKWMFTFRPSSLFASILSMKGCDHISMQAQTVDREIKGYLLSRLNSEAELTSYSQTTKNLIVERVSAKSDGMFRWAQCQLDALKKVNDRRIKNVGQVLNQLPDDIFKTYHRILESLASASERVLAVRVLLFICYSARPVTVSEAAEFAILEDCMQDIEPQDRFESFEDILLLLGNMVNVDRARLTLSHKTVHEFLLQTPTELRNVMNVDKTGIIDAKEGADLYIARRCLQYLAMKQKPVSEIQQPFTEKSPNTNQLYTLMKSYPLLEYAATNWPFHLGQQSTQTRLFDTMSSTLSVTAKPNLWKAWVMLQPADIWENRLALAQLLCKAAIRAAPVPDLTLHFWSERQAYRITRKSLQSNHVQEQIVRDKKDESTEARSKQSTSSKNAEKSTVTIPSLATILKDPNAERKRFHRGEFVFIEPKRDGHQQRLARTASRETILKTLRISARIPLTSRIVGLPFYYLAICLLEIATQTSIQPASLDSIDGSKQPLALQIHLSEFDEYIDSARSLMGEAYTRVVRECFSNVFYLSDDKAREFCSQVNGTGNSGRPQLSQYSVSAWYLFQRQDEFMDKLHTPLFTMMKSGYRASRSGGRSLHLPYVSKEAETPAIPNISVIRDRPSDSVQIAASPSVDHMRSQSPSGVDSDGRAEASAGAALRLGTNPKALSERPKYQEIPPALNPEAIGDQAQSFELELDHEELSSVKDKVTKVWMVDLCQQLLTDMANAVTDNGFSETLNLRKEWFWKLTEGQRTAILYTLSSESTFMQQYFLAQVILQRLENKPLPVQRIGIGSKPTCTAVYRMNTKTTTVDIRDRKPPLSYPKAARSIIGDRSSDLVPYSRQTPTATVGERWSSASRC